MDHLPYYADVQDGNVTNVPPRLYELTAAAVKSLQKRSDNGFFLLVENGKIDHGHHENRVKKTIVETLEFDKTIEVRNKINKH